MREELHAEGRQCVRGCITGAIAVLAVGITIPITGYPGDATGSILTAAAMAVAAGLCMVALMTEARNHQLVNDGQPGNDKSKGTCVPPYAQG